MVCLFLVHAVVGWTEVFDEVIQEKEFVDPISMSDIYIKLIKECKLVAS